MESEQENRFSYNSGKSKCFDNFGMNFVYIEPGDFLMGSPETEKNRWPDEVQHKVKVSKGFYIQGSPVTVSQWRNFIKSENYKTEAELNGGAYCYVKHNSWQLQWILPKFQWKLIDHCVWDNPGFPQQEDHPVTCISWNDIQAFIKWLNDSGDNEYRLPTEAEWEYACRAESESAFSFGKNLSVFRGNVERSILSFYKRFGILKFLHKNQKTNSVKRYCSNCWHLHDMHGNVWEWCQDKSEGMHKVPETFQDNIVDPVSSIGKEHILRGGSWAYYSRFSRSACRRSQLPDYRASGIGFRLVAQKNILN